MSQKPTILFDLDGTIIDTAPTMAAHNHVMKSLVTNKKNYRYQEISRFVCLDNDAEIIKEEIKDEKLKNDMTKEFLNFYSKNIDSHSKPINGIKKFLSWAKNKNISMALAQTNKKSWP